MQILFYEDYSYRPQFNLQRISIESGLHSDKPEVDIDDLMKTYAHALQREISVTDLVSGTYYYIHELKTSHLITLFRPCQPIK